MNRHENSPNNGQASAPTPLSQASIPPIVGIGASAGGLDALEKLLAHTPTNSGMAFVVIQHLDPCKNSMLTELLQRTTTMKVMEAGHNMRVEPNHVYVIPPNRDLSLRHGLLQLAPPLRSPGPHHPIDEFFRSLATEQHERAVGVILSGMGSDGTLGLAAIKDRGGRVLVQAPESCQFDAMPRSAIKAGLADIVAPPQQLTKSLPSPPDTAQPHSTDVEPALPALSRESLKQIITLLRERSRHDFSNYKDSTLMRRIERRMNVHRLENLSDYVQTLRENSQELDLLFREILIGVTRFFRDPEVWDTLREITLPALIKSLPAGKDFRAWVTACSSGEEAYTLAMVFQQVLETLKPASRFTLQIFATDIDEDAIQQARQGLYSGKIADEIPPELLERFFSRESENYRICKEIRDKVIFAPQNLVMDPPFTQLDILSCRNLLIYFKPQLQERLIALFHFALAPRGILILGKSETLCGQSGLFELMDSKSRLYRCTGQKRPPGFLDFSNRSFPLLTPEPTVDNIPATPPLMNLQKLADQFLLEQHTPAAVLFNADGDILYINGHTGKFLEPARGKANWNLHVMLREGLRDALALAVKQAQERTPEPVQVRALIHGKASDTAILLTVQEFNRPEGLQGLLMVIFQELPDSPKPRQPPGSAERALEEQLTNSRELIASLRQEMQTKQEELRSSIEDLQSMNEELQSTNEELTTAKEELQSLNEELQTINFELQAKLDDLSRANNDMTNLLESSEIATIFLDGSLNVRRFTSSCTKLFKLIPGDTGRPLSDIVTLLDYPDLQKDAEEVLRTLKFHDRQVSTGDGRWFQVRIKPYRTQSNLIDGLVITLLDISDLKKLEAELEGVRS